MNPTKNRHLNDYKFSLQTQELSCLWSRFKFFKFCTIKYIWNSLIGYFFLKESHSEIVHNYVISTQSRTTVV